MDLITIKGKFMQTIYRNEANGYTVARFLLDDLNAKELIVVGSIPPVAEDVLYNLSGYYKQHDRYGMQFQIEEFKPITPTDQEAIISYLSSPLFPGIGHKFAQKLYDYFGNNVVELLKNNIDLVDDVPKITKRQKEALINGLQSESQFEASYQLFSIHGLGTRNIMKIDRVYGKEAYNIIKDNPYRLITDIDGIGFKIADKIAMALDFALDDPKRLQAALIDLVLKQSLKQGDTYLDYEVLQQLFQKSFKTDDFDSLLKTVVSSGQLVQEDQRIYHHSQYSAEVIIAQSLLSFPFYPLGDSFDLKALKPLLPVVQSTIGIEYGAQQIKAIETFFTNDITIMTGGPGTGKTTVVRGMVSLFKQLYPNRIIALCAPTGRAAKRLSELTGAQSYTVHSLLKWDLESNTFGKNDNDPLIVDLLIIDEFSMVDNWLFAQLMKASAQVKKILIIGDEDQLPSVMPGSLLKDLIACQHYPVVRLDTIYRQKTGSGVIELSHQIKTGSVSSFTDFDDVRFFQLPTESIKEQLKNIVKEAMVKGYSLDDWVVLAPRYDYTLGIDDINQELQQLCNPPESGKKELRVGYRLFREGDKVLQLKNQPDDDVYNGDIGILVEIDTFDEQQKSMVVDFQGNFVVYNADRFMNLTHAYCISIHKSQGSEYPIVIMPILSRHRYMLNRQLIYTGVSRAKRSLILLGEATIFNEAIKTTQKHIRKTTLLDRLQKMGNGLEQNLD